jgi:hypothetical protein
MPAVFVGLRGVIGPAGREAMNVAVIGAAVESALIGVVLVFAALAAYSAPGLSARSARLPDLLFLQHDHAGPVPAAPPLRGKLDTGREPPLHIRA